METGKIKWVVAQPLCGGMPIGFQDAFGCPPTAIITAGFSNDEHYIQYKPGIPVIKMEVDYQTFKTDADKELYEQLCQNVDVLMHVAICSGLSQMNSSKSGSKKRGDADNDQNQNMYNLTKLGMRMNAKVVVYENAPAAYTKSGEETIKRIREIADGFKYTTHLLKTDTLFHGIPQSRQRTFIMFYRDSNPPYFEYEEKDFPLLMDYLDMIPKEAHHQFVVDQEALDPFYHFVLHHTKTKRMLDAVKVIDPEDKKSTWTSLQLTQAIGFDHAIKYFFKIKNEKAKRLAEHCQAKVKEGKNFWDSSTFITHQGRYMNAVVNKAANRMLQPKYERGYTVRELLWLMGHPHDFDLVEPTKNWTQISQNVPVKTATYIGNNIKKYLNGELNISTEVFVKQDNTKKRIDEPKNGENW